MCNLAAVCATMIAFHIKLGRFFFLINIMGVMICISVLLSSLFLFFYVVSILVTPPQNVISHCFRLFLSLRGLCKKKKGGGNVFFLKYRPIFDRET